jgi:hypothetical protein
MPSYSEEISWGTSPTHYFLAPHDLWQVQATDATILAWGDSRPFIVVKKYGKGFFIYHAAFQPLVGHGGFAPGTYSYVVFRRAIEWAFESLGLAVPKLSPWPYPYDSAFMVRHDLENFQSEIAHVEASSQVEFNAGVRGDYYFTTGTLRSDTAPRSPIITVACPIRATRRLAISAMITGTGGRTRCSSSPRRDTPTARPTPWLR